ncbi:hypothetical protein PDESU_03328 [Pontiella desulfatans]|uniref:Uncharacterized protein n=1 Tax=Pontiella desulfatans TaxID=2750659 RepID=A0A6C2U4K2_PONDE|nr:terminase gpA endonuclease subunit [Pontiella desulfatans]VGO14759.1 hypothetical protein PDESU_03328 [Pontiella desulfatans]
MTEPITIDGMSRQAKHNARKREDLQNIGTIPKPANVRRRNSCRKNLLKFLRTYLGQTFYLEFCDDQIAAVKSIEAAVMNGGLAAIAMPRGFGKTSISEGAAIWGILFGHIRFGVVIGSDQKAAESILADITTEFENNELLQDDFPEVCKPVEHLEGRVQRCGSQHVNGEPTHMQWKSARLVFPTVPKTKYTLARGSVLQAKGLTAGVRGLHHKNMDAKIRPDFVILDDPQTRESAKSFDQSEAREKIIRGDVMGLAGHDRVISAVMPCTVIEKGDLADRFLDRGNNPEWRGHRTKLVYAWGVKNKAKGSKHEYENSALWDAYKEIWQRCKLNGDMAEANAFYKSNRKAMDAGVEVASKYFYDSSEELSAVQHAFHLLYKVGEPAFLAEYQNEPPGEENDSYKIAADDVRNALNHLGRRKLPNEAQYLTAMIDVNYLGLNWAAAGFDSKRAGWIADYGKYPDGRKWLWSKAIAAKQGLTEEQAVYQGVMKLGELLHSTEFVREDGTRIFFNAIMFDANYMTDTVAKACKALSRKLNFQVWTSRSRPTKQYRTARGAKVMKRAQDVHLEKNDRGFECVYVSDRWQKDAQQGFKLFAGAPLSISLFGNDPLKHERMGAEIASQQLLQLLRGDIVDSYTWTPPNGRNDLLDAVKGCIAAAALLGAGQADPVKRRAKKARKPRVQKIQI